MLDYSKASKLLFQASIPLEYALNSFVLSNIILAMLLKLPLNKLLGSNEFS